MSRLVFIFCFFAAVLAFSAAETNYFCVVCGKGPLTGQIWISKWGAVCDDCYHLKDHCSICGLPIKDGDGHIKTPDGRLICRFDKTNVVLTLDQAKELFDQVREEVVDIYGQRFALKYPEVTLICSTWIIGRRETARTACINSVSPARARRRTAPAHTRS